MILKDYLIYLLSTLVILGSTLMEVFHTSGKPETRISEFPEFRKVGVNVPCTVYLQKGTHHQLIYEGNSAILKNLEVNFSNGTLILNSANNAMLDKLRSWFFPGNYCLRVYITMENLDEIQLHKKTTLIRNAALAPGTTANSQKLKIDSLPYTFINFKPF
jgi:hypothetical protein